MPGPTTSGRSTPTRPPRQRPTGWKRPADVRHVTEIIEDGRYAIACVRARVAGEPLPTRRPPCFFDPRHGLSVDDVEWTPPGGTTRQVPACALDAERVRAGAEPDTRQIMVGAQRMPYYEGGRAYAPYAAGYFGGGMNLLFTGLLVGSLMDGGLGFGDGYGDGGGDGGDGGDSVTGAGTAATGAGAAMPEVTSVGATSVEVTSVGETSEAATSEGSDLGRFDG